MRERLKLILPSINIAVAAVLLWVGYMRPLREWAPTPWETVLCFSINAPANLLRNLVVFMWDKHVHPHCFSDGCFVAERWIELGIFLCAVAFVWYVVGLEIDASGRGTRAAERLGIPTRMLLDVTFFGAGSLFGFLFIANLKSMHLVLTSWVDRLGVFCYLAWALAILVHYGRDLILCVARSWLRRP